MTVYLILGLGILGLLVHAVVGNATGRLRPGGEDPSARLGGRGASAEFGRQR
jgi:hypothetical protein